MQNIIIPNPEELEQKIRTFSQQGVEHLHVLADFDRTLTKAFYQSKKAGSIISQLRKDKGRYLTPDYADKSQALFDKYHPIEIDSSIPQEEKKKKMYEWWKAHKLLLIDSGFDKQTIQQSVRNMINEDTLALRDKTKEFLDCLNQNNIPLVIMSSSLQDLIEEYMRQINILYQNTHIIANAFKFNPSGKATGIERIIQVFNKNEMSLENLSIYKQLLKRKNIILLGDSLGDLGMSDGFPYKNIIRIGFLNENIEQNLKQYKQAYDVIITNDGDFSYINSLLRKII